MHSHFVGSVEEKYGVDLHLLSASRILEGEGRKGETDIFVSKKVCPVVFPSILDDEKSCGHLGGMTQVFFR